MAGQRQRNADQSESKAHTLFVSGPIGEKPVEDLAGIGKALGKKLREHGIDKAYAVLGKFIDLMRNEEIFKNWLKTITEANTRQCSECYRCLNDWCDSYLIQSPNDNQDNP